MTLHPVRAGTRFFDDSPVTATDPCYDNKVACVLYNLRVKPGEYECIAWKGREYYTGIDNKRHSCQRVFTCGIYLDGEIPDVREKQRLGCIGVDAGMAGFFQNKPNYDSDEEWFAFCDRVHDKDYLITPEGFLTSSGYGDGVYPVYAYKNEDDDIVALEIKF